MGSVCLSFHAHQPHRLKRYGMFEIGVHSQYFDEHANKNILDSISNTCYSPANSLLKELLTEHKGEFKVSFSITGTMIDQLEKHRPDVLQSFKELAQTGHVEFIAETYYHSLAHMYSKEEFEYQINLHKEKIMEHFEQSPTVFRNSNLLFNHDIAGYVQGLGFKGILTQANKDTFESQIPHFVYRRGKTSSVTVLVNNHALSKEVTQYMADQDSSSTVQKYASRIHQAGELVNIFIDYETFGEHNKESTGVFDFLQNLPSEILSYPDNNFVTVSQAIQQYRTTHYVDAGDDEYTHGTWITNVMQDRSIQALYDLEKRIKSCGDEKLIRDWRQLTSSDHLNYMRIQGSGDVDKNFSVFESPYEGFIAFMNALQDVELRLKECEQLVVA